MEKSMEQKLEWLEAQKIEISIDLFAAAKQQLEFLGVVDQLQWLYDGPALERAIYRYNAYWLPLLSKYTESSSICEGPLVPPLDCEWVWHCHRLNPLRYKSDCEQFYGRVLDNSGVVSSVVNGNCKSQTEALWKSMYPMEPYDLDLDKAISKPNNLSTLEKCTTYDLVSAVKRQSSFYNEVSRAHVENDIILREAVARYKAFLYLIKRNHENLIELISVPTYDIDLIWHTHQLNPLSYCNDLEKIIGTILQHDDNDSDQSEGNKLDTGFSGTTSQWEEVFGQRYSKDSVETSTIVVALEKRDVGARCLAFAEAAEKHDVGARCLATTVKKRDVGGRCLAFAEAAGNHDAGARCLATTVKKSDVGARCLAFVEAAEKHDVGARCLATTIKKRDVGARFLAFAEAAEKHDVGARCFATTNEKHDAGARCFAMVAEKHVADARCLAFVDVADKHGVGARCFAAGARCFAVTSEKRGTDARCFVVATEKKSAEKNSGGCGNMVKNNANENVPSAETLNGAVTA